jgi:hypothetical protein
VNRQRRRSPVPILFGLGILLGIIIAVPVILILQHNSTQQGTQPGSGQQTVTTTSTTKPANNTTPVPVNTSPGFSSPYGFTVADAIDPDLIARYKQLNIYWVREQLPWNRIETAPGVYDWSKLDPQIQLANASGLHVSFVLQGAPSCHLHPPCNLPGASDMAAYATAVAQRYNGKSGHGYIDSFEIGNEEYTPFQLAPASSCSVADNYVPVLKAGYLAVKANSPHALVVTFGSAWESIQGIQTFYERMYQLGAKPYFDAANLHYYNHVNTTDANPALADPGKPDFPTFDQRWQTVHQVMVQNGDGNKGIWISEIGWPTLPKKNIPTVSPQTQASYLQYVLTEAMQSHVISKVFWYTINTAQSLYHDKADDIYPNYPNDTGPLPAFTTYQQFVAQHPTWSGAPYP